MMTDAALKDSEATRRTWGRRGTASAFADPRPDKLERWTAHHSTWLAIGVIVAAVAVRVAYASSCYLNPDEAQHFNAARASSWLQAYEASRLLAHPPLLIFVLHAFLIFGRSELILRMPSIVSGALSLWFAFAWIRRSLGDIPALAGLLFLAISPAAVSASTEVRQYGLLLCFLCGSLYATERALSEGSVKWASVQGLFLIGAILTHYTAPLVILSLALYVLLCAVLGGVPKRVLSAIGAGNILVAGVFGWLYYEQLRGGGLRNVTTLDYIRQKYYTGGVETLLGFSKRAFVGTFGYMVNGRFAIFSMLVFISGLAAILARRTKAPRSIAFLIVCPLAIGFATALCQLLPFTGSHHQVYLLPFIAAGFSAALIWLPRRIRVPILLLVAVAAPLWLLHNPPDNDPRVMPIRDATSMLASIRQNVPANAPIFVDNETLYFLGYYLGRNDPALDSSHLLRAEESIGVRRFLEPESYAWSFGPQSVVSQVSGVAAAVGIARGAPVWIVSVAWPQRHSLASQLPTELQRNSREFGVISVIRINRE